MIKLGSVVRDRVSGVVGVAESRASFMFGCDRYCVQPKAEKDSASQPDHFMVDEMQLDVVALPVVVPKRAAAAVFKFGQVVVDLVTKRTGVVSGRAVYLNGCARVYVEGPEGSEPFWIEEGRLVPKRNFFGREMMVPLPKRKKENFDFEADRLRGGPSPSSKR